jgi:hypothetical protein
VAVGAILVFGCDGQAEAVTWGAAVLVVVVVDPAAKLNVRGWDGPGGIEGLSVDDGWEGPGGIEGLNVEDDCCCCCCCGCELVTNDAGVFFDDIIGGGLTLVDTCSSADFVVSIHWPVFSSYLN